MICGGGSSDEECDDARDEIDSNSDQDEADGMKDDAASNDRVMMNGNRGVQNV